LKALTKVELSTEEEDDLEELGFEAEKADANAALLDDPMYCDILKADVVAGLRQQVTTLRASGHRRRALKQMIRDLNKTNVTERALRVRNLLRDMDVRWSSTFLMIDRALDLAPVRAYPAQAFKY
jgi:hypothetical protein